MSITGSPHIVMLNKCYPPWVGGIERHVADLSKALVKRGWRVTALVVNDQRHETHERINGVEVIRTSRLGNVLSQPITRRYFVRLRELQPDLVHVHVPYPLGWLTADRLHSQTPVVATWHSDIIRQRWLMPLLRPFEKRFLQRCQRVIATSQPLVQNSHSLKKYQDRCRVIPLGLPPDSQAPKAEIASCRAQIEERYPQPRLLFVGRLVGYKGLPFLLAAMRAIEATLLIAGDGPERGRLQDQCQQAGLEDKVYFLGRVDESMKQALYRSADLFVLPSITANEAFGYVLLEAMREGCPLITTDLPTGVRFVNQDQQTGLVVSPGDAPALEQAIKRLLGDDALRQQMGTKAKQRFDATFNFDGLIDAHEALYREVLAESGSGG